jgi:hypothetical protein
MNRAASLSELRRLVGALLEKALTFAEFEKRYVEFFADNNADEFFTDSDHDLYGALFERLQWTVERPSSFDRADGYHSADETEEWIRRRFADLS